MPVMLVNSLIVFNSGKLLLIVTHLGEFLLSINPTKLGISGSSPEIGTWDEVGAVRAQCGCSSHLERAHAAEVLPPEDPGKSCQHLPTFANDHQQSSTIINDHQRSSTIISHQQRSSTIISDHQQSSAIINNHQR